MKRLAGIVCIVFFCAGLLNCADAPDMLSRIDPLDHAKRHAIEYNRPAVTFFEGAILGNGGLGAIVTTRPDAVAIRFGHNDVWDIRLAENNKDKIGTFRELFDKVDAIPDTTGSLTDVKWYREYLAVMRENYAKSYPRPFPCGSVFLWFDRRTAELLGHRVRIDTGICEVDFLVDGAVHRLEVFCDMRGDTLRARMVDDTGRPVPSPFVYITVVPDPDTPSELPKYTASSDPDNGAISFRQILPYEEVTKENPHKKHPRDKAFRLTACVGGRLTSLDLATDRDNIGLGPIPALKTGTDLKGAIDRTADFYLSVRLDQGLADTIDSAEAAIPSPGRESFEEAAEQSREVWRQYWRKSGIAIGDDVLERTWYRNLYFLRCALRPGVTCPGLFANWSYRNIGTAWHGDYHMNYNTQQPFWAAFSSNHVDLHIPYVDMVETCLLPVSRKWARDYYGMRGAFFPHSAYPVEMTIMPYPLPTWGWEVFETPWTVQSLWWHYIYTMDEAFLRQRAFPVIREAVLFLVDYMKHPEAHGGRWGDDKYHIFPSVPPELYGLQPGFDKNYDTIADLTLTRFVFNAYLEACGILKLDDTESALMKDVETILGSFPSYPTAQSSRGEVFVSVDGEDPDVVYNVPASLMTVFPGEHHGLHSPPGDYARALNTFRNQQNEGGNDIVFLNIQAARLGALDLEKFKRQIEYSVLPNGTCADKVLQIHGRYTNNTPFDFMAPMGIWFENFSLPVVINECLLQSYNGELRFFPNWPDGKPAEFRTLRAVGAFLVSAHHDGGGVEWIEIESEAGHPLTIFSPWKTGAGIETAAGKSTLNERIIRLKTKPGEIIRLRPAG